jgi:hypothetical protein
MSQQIAASIRSVLYGLRDQLLGQLVVPTKEQIIFAAEEDPMFRESLQDIVFQVGKEKPWKQNDIASGRVNYVTTRELTIHIRSQFVTDYADLDIDAILAQTTGHVSLEDAVYNALHDFQPVDEAGNLLIADTIKLWDLTAPKRHPKRPEWVVSKISTEIKYQRVMSLQNNTFF